MFASCVEVSGSIVESLKDSSPRSIRSRKEILSDMPGKRKALGTKIATMITIETIPMVISMDTKADIIGRRVGCLRYLIK
jgi:hypothetical protein